MRERIAKLIDLKSIITLILIGVFSFLALKGTIGADKFAEVVTMIIVFYFAKKESGING